MAVSTGAQAQFLVLCLLPPGATDSWPIWYRFMKLTGAFVNALAPVCVVARLASTRHRPRVPAIDAAGADVSH